MASIHLVLLGCMDSSARIPEQLWTYISQMLQLKPRQLLDSQNTKLRSETERIGRKEGRYHRQTGGQK